MSLLRTQKAGNYSGDELQHVQQWGQLLMAIIDKLDIRRAQVLVEAIIVELQSTKAAEFGTNFLVDGTTSDKLVPTPVTGLGQGAATAIAADASGSAYVGGYTYSANFPTTAASMPAVMMPKAFPAVTKASCGSRSSK